MTNPQNTQFYGTINNPYPLEVKSLHKFLIPDEENDVPDGDLELFCGDVKIKAAFRIIESKLYSVTFMSNEILRGRLEIRRKDKVLFYSNCVAFVNSTDDRGRKYIRVATRHNYNRHLFKFDKSPYEWIVTNLPAYCMGQFSVEAEISNARIGGNNTLKTRETYLDEAVLYHFIANGDANILAFIQVHTTNTEFYIDGTKRTVLDKIDADEFGIGGKLKFVNQKDSKGLNIVLDEKDIFPKEDLDRLYLIRVSDTEYHFTYKHSPINTLKARQYFLVNRLFNNYHHSEEILLDCDLKAIIKEIPTRGQLVYLSTMKNISVGDQINYCDKDDVVYIPNGINNEMGVYGNFTEYIRYNIIDQWGNESKEINTATLHLVDIGIRQCVAPTLVNISFRNSREVVFAWDIKGMADYTDMELEYSIDNGNNYQSLGIYDITQNIIKDEGVITTDVLKKLEYGQNILFRLNAIGGICKKMTSNTIEKIWDVATPIKIYWYYAQRLRVGDMEDKMGVGNSVEVGAEENLLFEYKNPNMDYWGPLFIGGVNNASFVVSVPIETTGTTEIRAYKEENGEKIYSNILRYTKTEHKKIMKSYQIEGIGNVNYQYIDHNGQLVEKIYSDDFIRLFDIICAEQGSVSGDGVSITEIGEC